MSCFGGPDPLESELIKQSKMIDKELEEFRKKESAIIKILLLGPGESGKSTVYKQMKILNEGYTVEERLSFRYIIYTNIISQIKILCSASLRLGIPMEGPDNEISSHGDNWSEGVAQDCLELWKDPGFGKCIEEHLNKEFQLNDSTTYFMENLPRIMQSDYTPSEQDILRARVRSTGIEEANFSFKELDFTLLDVGGISEYDQKLREDETQNRMVESLMLFEDICNSPWFRTTSLVLFLNKMDIFKEKVKKVPLTGCFPDYTGGPDFETATNFITEKFLERNLNKDHKVYPHITCAIDTKQISVVFNAVKEILQGK